MVIREPDYLESSPNRISMKDVSAQDVKDENVYDQ